MKKTFGISAIVLAIAVLGYVYISSSVESHMTRLLSLYDINFEIFELECFTAKRGRSGHCNFTRNADLADLEARLRRDLSARRRTTTVTVKSPIGDGKCKKLGASFRQIFPKTQLGGLELPYLGAVYLSPTEKRGCLEYAFGFG